MNNKVINFMLVTVFLVYSQLSIAGNGCGTGWNKKLVRDSYFGANFTNSCNIHDACYENCGDTHSRCDKEFRDNLKKECRSTYTKAIHVVQKNACLKIADGYYASVKKMGGDAYRKAQKKAQCVTGCGRAVKIFTTIAGEQCGLEWASGKGEPVGQNERVAKFDCSGGADSMCISTSGSESYIFSRVEGERCSLEFNTAKGGFPGINDYENLAKFDCNTNGDPMIVTGDRIYTIIDEEKCYLEWSTTFEGGHVGTHEKVAKFDCSGNGEALIFR